MNWNMIVISFLFTLLPFLLLSLLLWGGFSKKGRELPLKITIPLWCILLLIIFFLNRVVGTAGIFILLMIFCHGGNKEGFSPLRDTAKLLLGVLFWGGISYLLRLFLQIHYNVRNHHAYQKCLKKLLENPEAPPLAEFTLEPRLLFFAAAALLLFFLTLFLFRRAGKKCWNWKDGLLLFFLPLFFFSAIVTLQSYREQQKEEIWVKNELACLIRLCREKKSLLTGMEIRDSLTKSLKKYRFTYERPLRENFYLKEIPLTLKKDLQAKTSQPITR